MTSPTRTTTTTTTTPIGTKRKRSATTLDDDVSPTTASAAKTKPKRASRSNGNQSSHSKQDPPNNETVSAAAAAIQRRLAGSSLPAETPGLDDAIEKLKDLAAASIVNAESNSVLLIGPRSSGKTMVIRKTLAQFPQDKFIAVHLDGLFHTSDQLAVKDIVRQLQMESQIECARPSSVSECLKFVIDTLNSGSKENIPVVFVLEEFDLFALHPKQSLLYTLFDIAQTCVNPVFVIGASQRQDSIELLEKRVKSRFSHRVIFTYPPQDVDDFTVLVRNAITLSPKEDGLLGHEDYCTEFNRRAESLLASSFYKSIAQEIVMGTCDVREMFGLFTSQLLSLSPEQPYLTLDGFKFACVSQLQSPVRDMFNAISPLEQALLVGIKQCLDRHIVPFNFEIVNDFLKDFLKANERSMAALRFKKDVVFKAFESLQAMEFITPIDGSGNRCPKMHKMFKVNLSIGDICDLVMECEDCPEAVQKWCQS
ncbi:origin recognition complex, subunit 4 [Rhizoclosmatium globosum]|uniref:Origin recognition complex subunit 4 n=1 Tax=Rhizoclosmatium globosum TaxID=329046 RepID=A0A1Y2CAF0_9FUNG|nr:origin recognition complex, subunit 4 [Rhizoclosmatium globosum]|eukprot:ORY43834.1 origin recognition complex, subunit 4 [Rhizoclosmatium globosum]